MAEMKVFVINLDEQEKDTGCAWFTLPCNIEALKQSIGLPPDSDRYLISDYDFPFEILEEAGTSFDKVLKTTCFLADMGDFSAFNEVYAKYFTSKPARSCVAVKTLPKNLLCEIEVIAAVEE